MNAAFVLLSSAWLAGADTPATPSPTSHGSSAPAVVSTGSACAGDCATAGGCATACDPCEMEKMGLFSRLKGKMGGPGLFSRMKGKFSKHSSGCCETVAEPCCAEHAGVITPAPAHATPHPTTTHPLPTTTPEKKMMEPLPDPREAPKKMPNEEKKTQITPVRPNQVVTPVSAPTRPVIEIGNTNPF